MATATPSPLASSVEKTNGYKLSRLLIDGGTTVLRNIFDSHHPPANLAANLSSRHIHPILTRLRHRNILNGVQWDKLFPPPGGGPPNSINFDITLLFLLLRNICSLHPPLSGWDRMPPASDTSFEANLARIKYYRNVLYGHVTTTGIQTPVFDVKWQEVSSVLVSLGLSQSEVDRLKREPCGEDYISAVTEWMKNDEEIQFQLKDLRTKQQQVLQTQQEHHRTLQEGHRTLQDTQQTVGRVEQTLQDTHQAVGNLQQMLQEVRTTQQESQQQIKREAANTQERGDKAEEDEALRKLAQVNTERVIQYHSGKYQEGTRLHIFEKIKLWLDDLSSENRVMVISGDAGMGKSVISAVVCQRMQHAGRLSGSHFCQHNKERYRNPKVMLQSLACQLCDVLPEYKSELVKKLSRNLGVDMNSLEVQELFEFLFEEPLCSVGDPGRNLLLVIDGLDESEYKGRNDLLDVVANYFCKLPVWFRFLVTTRPEVNIADRLEKFNPIQLEQDNEENVKDIRLFLEKQLSSVIQSGSEDVVIDALVRKAVGHFLYAYLMANFIKKNVSLLTLEELGRTLPSGVSSVYQSYFERLEKELTISEDQFLTFLSALAAAREPLPLDFVSKMLLSDAKSSAGHRKVRMTIECISTLLPVQDGGIHFFHKSVKDWLTDRTAYGRHDFSVDQNQGHSILSQLCTDELNDLKIKDLHRTEFSDTAKYALQHGVRHMLESEESARASSKFEEIVKNYVTDLDIVYAKLCVNNTASSEDIILTQKQDAFQLLSSERQKALGTLLSLLRKYHERLTTHPSAILQVMANEGGDVCAGEATKLLQKYEIPYMEYIQDMAEEKQWEVQASFCCTSPVICFDISPQKEFMVCECKDGRIHLWSLQTGNLVWIRPVKVEKCYDDDPSAFRTLPNSLALSCYRSVVFHPSEAIVLPGILSHAYTFEGDRLPLFPGSNCRFLICSINDDENKMITDFPDDPKCLVMWNLENGEKIIQISRNEVILSFAWSPDGKLLAISHLSGLICLVDAKNCFKVLAEVANSHACGIIKFAPSLQFLYCLSVKEKKRLLYPNLKDFRLMVSKSPCGIFSLAVSDGNFDYVPLIDESFSKGGFLMGDPIASWLCDRDCQLSFVLDNQRIVKASFFGDEAIVISVPTAFRNTASYRRFAHVAFALDGKTIYGVSEGNEAALVSLDVFSGELKAETKVRSLAANLYTYDICLVPVINGVLLKASGVDVQLWNFELSQVRSWSSLCEVTSIMPVTDQCVACVTHVDGKFEVSILDTSSGDIVKTISLRLPGYTVTFPLHGVAIVCNSKYQLLFTDGDSVQLSSGNSLLWKRDFSEVSNSEMLLSPTEEFVLISLYKRQNEVTLVLDASSGNTLHTLCTVDFIVDWAFVSNTECVINCVGPEQRSGGTILQLFNVTTGDLLSFLDMFIRPSCLASFPQNGLIAIGLKYSQRMCAFIKVKLPRDKVNKEGFKLR